MGAVSVWDGEKFLEMDGGDDCTTVWMHLMNYPPKMVKMVNFLMYIMYRKKSSM